MLLLVRHGETDGNRTRTLQKPEIPLNENGFEQARQCGERIQREFKVHRIISSDHQRTMDTANAISKATGVQVEATPLLQERSFGNLRGLKFAHLAEQGINPFDPEYIPPHGESVKMFDVRVEKAWEMLMEQVKTVPKGEVLVAVSHGLVLNGFARFNIKLSEADKKLRIVPFSNTSITLIDPNESGAPPFTPINNLFNDDSHVSEDQKDQEFAAVLGGRPKL